MSIYMQWYFAISRSATFQIVQLPYNDMGCFWKFNKILKSTIILNLVVQLVLQTLKLNSNIRINFILPVQLLMNHKCVHVWTYKLSINRLYPIISTGTIQEKPMLTGENSDSTAAHSDDCKYILPGNQGRSHVSLSLVSTGLSFNTYSRVLECRWCHAHLVFYTSVRNSSRGDKIHCFVSMGSLSIESWRR